MLAGWTQNRKPSSAALQMDDPGLCLSFSEPQSESYRSKRHSLVYMMHQKGLEGGGISQMSSSVQT